jgi:galactokinase
MTDASIESLEQIASRVAARFETHYGRPPRWVAAAPGRVNLIGEHTDYNDGYVLPMAIERYTVVAADRPAGGASRRQVAWHCARTGESAAIDLTPPLQRGEPHWANYVRGVIAGCLERSIDPGPLQVLMDSTVPLGGGLSSSAALEVAAATLLEGVTGTRLDPVEKALLCQKAEHRFAGVPCGIMDQFISVMGRKDHCLLLDCQNRATELVPMSDPGVEVLIVNTNVRHELAGGEYARRRSQCESAARGLGVPSLRAATAEQLLEAQSRLEPVVFARAKHVVSEIERTVHAAHGLRAGNWIAVGQLMYASHLSLRDDYQVSCAELDAVVDIASDLGVAGGVYGCRMTGGGFGGCAVCLVRTDRVESIGRALADRYTRTTGRSASLFVSRPADGARLLAG